MLLIFPMHPIASQPFLLVQLITYRRLFVFFTTSLNFDSLLMFSTVQPNNLNCRALVRLLVFSGYDPNRLICSPRNDENSFSNSGVT